jgi:hypothetical protein
MTQETPSEVPTNEAMDAFFSSGTVNEVLDEAHKAVMASVPTKPLPTPEEVQKYRADQKRIPPEPVSHTKKKFPIISRRSKGGSRGK